MWKSCEAPEHTVKEPPERAWPAGPALCQARSSGHSGSHGPWLLLSALVLASTPSPQCRADRTRLRHAAENRASGAGVCEGRVTEDGKGASSSLTCKGRAFLKLRSIYKEIDPGRWPPLFVELPWQLLGHRL